MFHVLAGWQPWLSPPPNARSPPRGCKNKNSSINVPQVSRSGCHFLRALSLGSLTAMPSQADPLRSGIPKRLLCVPPTTTARRGTAGPLASAVLPHKDLHVSKIRLVDIARPPPCPHWVRTGVLPWASFIHVTCQRCRMGWLACVTA